MYRLLDQPFTKAFKTILILPQHFPTALLYLPIDHGGIGLPRVSDRAQVMKWRAFHRSLAVGSHPHQAITDILNRLPHETPPGLPIQILQTPPAWKPRLRLLARSLVEWLTQSGLVLAQTTHETPLQAATRQRNRISLQSVAQDIHLWYDPTIHDPDLPLLPLSFYVTDGSFRINTQSFADILAAEHTLRQHGTGAAGIVFQSPARDRAPLPHTVRIITEVEEPGLSAYAWELIAQVVALRMTQFYPNSITGYSDCTATISRINSALSSFLDLQSFETAGILTTAAHAQSSTSFPRTIRHIKAHPENDADRMANLTPLDRAIFLADAIAGNTPPCLNNEFINHVPHRLVLEDIMTELIPLHTWHLRRLDNMKTPVLDLPWSYQHHAQLQQYLTTRDSGATLPSTYWQCTAIDFMNAVHPLPTGYRSPYWHAARRSVRIFDWIGHGRNQAKYASRITCHPSPQTLTVPLCAHCGQQDDQAHIMLTCTLPALTPIRQRAKRLQSFAASTLRSKYHSTTDRYIIDQLLHCSWTSHPTNTRRLWLGTWTVSLLATIFPSTASPTQPMPTPDRYKYRNLIRDLTFPLTFAYRQMLKLHRANSSHSARPPCAPTGRMRNRIGLLIPQLALPGATPSLLHQQSYIDPDAFTLSDAAHSMTESSLGLHRIT